jgi:steroid delta-isomerase
MKTTDRFPHASARVCDIMEWFETLTVTSLNEIETIYAEQATFRDPFNDVSGVHSIHAIYAHMFKNLEAPRFVMTSVIEQDRAVFVGWQFLFGWRARQFDIPGATQFYLGENGLIQKHQDYWDVAEGLYEKLPVLGLILRRLRLAMATPL